MPTYEFFCEKCDIEFEVTKSIKEYKTPEACTACGNVATKLFSKSVFFTGTKIEDAEYNPGLGIITKSKKHRDEVVKQKNLIEIGNEKPETIHRHHDKARAEKRKKSWENV
jgi:putative FmdB family regulatory protein